jgi:hypothetical protein
MPRLSHFLDSQITDGGDVISLTSWLPLNPGRFLVPISVGGWVDPRVILRQEILGQLKKRKFLATLMHHIIAYTKANE